MKRIDADGHLSNQFQDGDPSSGIKGTQVDAAWLNSVQEELAAVVEGAGATLDASDTGQLLAALRGFYRADVFLAADSGGANAYVLSATGVAPTALFDGLRVRFRPATDNTGASTVNFAGLGLKSISNCSTGFIKAGNMTELEFDSVADAFKIVNAAPFLSGTYGFSISGGIINQWEDFTSTSDVDEDFVFNTPLPSVNLQVDVVPTQGTTPGVLFVIGRTLTGFTINRNDEIPGNVTFRACITGY